MEILSFLAPLAVLAPTKNDSPSPDEALPTFAPRWWYRNDRLDARPIAWSLYNRPDDWEADHEGYTVRHKPSQHRFWIANGLGHYALYDAKCSCSRTGGKFQRFHQFVFRRAYLHWNRNRTIYDPAEFSSHFVR